jgi:haloalkane dehalogenase
MTAPADLPPRQFINTDPRAILFGRQRELCRTRANQSEITGGGLHFIQEDSGAAIGQAVANWLSQIDERKKR